jgi:hypothetical protein
VYTLTPDANYNIVVKVTRAFDSRRDEEAAMVGDLISANPQLITWFGDLWLKNQDGPGHTEMAERAKMMLAPPIQQMLAQQAQGQSPVPPAIQAQMQQLQQRLQDAEKLLQHAAQELQSDSAKYQTELRRTQMEIESKERIAALDRETKITVAELGAKVDRMSLFLEERARIGSQQHEAAMSVMDQQHQAEQAGMGQEHEAAQAGMDRVHQAALGAQGHVQALEQGAQAQQAQAAENAAPEPAGAV